MSLTIQNRQAEMTSSAYVWIGYFLNFRQSGTAVTMDDSDLFRAGRVYRKVHGFVCGAHTFNKTILHMN
jgi:hypothetical protein